MLFPNFLDFYNHYKLIIFFLFLHYSFIKNGRFIICICTVAKCENRYINEFIEYYKKNGIDKIYLYDNNDLNGENFDFLQNEKISKFIEIINYRGKKIRQKEIYNKFYYNNNKKCKWIIFIDIDEYIFLKAYSDIHIYLSQPQFKKCDSIYLNWAIHTDNDLLYYDNRTLKKRFPNVNKDKNFCIGKSIVKANIENITIKSVHTLDENLKICDGFGKIITLNRFYCPVPDYEFNFIDHYQHKSTEEFIEKLKVKGDCVYKNNSTRKYKKIFVYFKDNNITKKKIDFISKKVGLNSTYIKENLNMTNK